MAYGDRRDSAKIDLYVHTPDGLRYVVSTTWARSLKEARERFVVAYPRFGMPGRVVARYAERRN